MLRHCSRLIIGEAVITLPAELLKLSSMFTDRTPNGLHRAFDCTVFIRSSTVGGATFHSKEMFHMNQDL